MSDELGRAIQKSFIGAEVRTGEELHPDALASGLIGSQAAIRGNAGAWTESRFYFAWAAGKVQVEVWDVLMLSRHIKDSSKTDDIGALQQDDQGTIVRLQPAASSLNLIALPLDMTLLARADSKTNPGVRRALYVVLFFVTAFAAVPLIAGAPLAFCAGWAAVTYGIVAALFVIARVMTREDRQAQEDSVDSFLACGLPREVLEQFQLTGNPKQPAVKPLVAALHALRGRFPDKEPAASQKGDAVFLYLRGLDIAGPLATMRHKVGLMSGESTATERAAELKRVLDSFLREKLFTG